MGYGKDFLTGDFGMVERHHIFGGALRKKSERYGMVVELFPWNHREGPKAAHRCKATADKLKRYGQRKVMLEQGWDADTFIREFGKNYLDERDLEEVYSMQDNEFCYEPPWVEETPWEDWELEGPTENMRDPDDTEDCDVTRTLEKVRFTPGGGFRVTVEVMPF